MAGAEDLILNEAGQPKSDVIQSEVLAPLSVRDQFDALLPRQAALKTERSHTREVLSESAEKINDANDTLGNILNNLGQKSSEVLDRADGAMTNLNRAAGNLPIENFVRVIMGDETYNQKLQRQSLRRSEQELQRLGRERTNATQLHALTVSSAQQAASTAKDVLTFDRQGLLDEVSRINLGLQVKKHVRAEDMQELRALTREQLNEIQQGTEEGDRLLAGLPEDLQDEPGVIASVFIEKTAAFLDMDNKLLTNQASRLILQRQARDLDIEDALSTMTPEGRDLAADGKTEVPEGATYNKVQLMRKAAEFQKVQYQALAARELAKNRGLDRSLKQREQFEQSQLNAQTHRQLKTVFEKGEGLTVDIGDDTGPDVKVLVSPQVVSKFVTESFKGRAAALATTGAETVAMLAVQQKQQEITRRVSDFAALTGTVPPKVIQEMTTAVSAAKVLQRDNPVAAAKILDEAFKSSDASYQKIKSKQSIAVQNWVDGTPGLTTRAEGASWQTANAGKKIAPTSQLKGAQQLDFFSTALSKIKIRTPAEVSIEVSSGDEGGFLREVIPSAKKEDIRRMDEALGQRVNPDDPKSPTIMKTIQQQFTRDNVRQTIQRFASNTKLEVPGELGGTLNIWKEFWVEERGMLSPQFYKLVNGKSIFNFKSLRQELLLRTLEFQQQGILRPNENLLDMLASGMGENLQTLEAEINADMDMGLTMQNVTGSDVRGFLFRGIENSIASATIQGDQVSASQMLQDMTERSLELADPTAKSVTGLTDFLAAEGGVSASSQINERGPLESTAVRRLRSIGSR